jgi:hypothetical protein
MPASGKLQTYLSNVLPKTSGIKKIAKITPRAVKPPYLRHQSV